MGQGYTEPLSARRRGVANPQRYCITFDRAGNRHTHRLWAVSEDAAGRALHNAFPGGVTIIELELED